MIDEARIDAYVVRIKEVQVFLETLGWFAIRNDEWASPSGDTIRFSYAHREFRVFTRFIDREPETHHIRIRDAADAHVPTVKEIVYSILDLNRASWRSNAAQAAAGVVSQPQA